GSASGVVAARRAAVIHRLRFRGRRGRVGLDTGSGVAPLGGRGLFCSRLRNATAVCLPRTRLRGRWSRREGSLSRRETALGGLALQAVEAGEQGRLVLV